MSCTRSGYAPACKLPIEAHGEAGRTSFWINVDIPSWGQYTSILFGSLAFGGNSDDTNATGIQLTASEGGTILQAFYPAANGVRQYTMPGWSLPDNLAVQTWTLVHLRVTGLGSSFPYASVWLNGKSEIFQQVLPQSNPEPGLELDVGARWIPASITNSWDVHLADVVLYTLQ